MPFVASVSAREPASIQAPTVAVWAVGFVSVATVRPLERVEVLVVGCNPDTNPSAFYPADKGKMAKKLTLWLIAVAIDLGKASDGFDGLNTAEAGCLRAPLSKKRADMLQTNGGERSRGEED